MQILKHPTFFESWREATPDERNDLIFIWMLIVTVALVMASTAAVIGGLVALVGGFHVGIGVAIGLFAIGAINVFGR